MSKSTRDLKIKEFITQGISYKEIGKNLGLQNKVLVRLKSENFQKLLSCVKNKMAE